MKVTQFAYGGGAALALLALTISSAHATVMVELPLDEMIRDATWIVHGEVVESGVRMAMRPDSLEPQTLTTIRVREWVGSAPPGAPQTVQVRELGGVWQGGGLRYEGTPRYTPGEEVIVFLERRSEAPHDFRTLGMVQGKFRVLHGVPGVPSAVSRDLEGIAFAHWRDGHQTVAAPGAEPAIELETFLEHLRRVRASALGLTLGGDAR